MKTKYIEIPRDNWGIVIVHSYDDTDFYDLAAVMESFNLPDYKIDEALDVLSEPNTGMTISRFDIRMSVMFISYATSEKQWYNTIFHECKHVADAILDYYDVKYDSEEAAYLTGFIAEKIIDLFGEPCN